MNPTRMICASFVLLVTLPLQAQHAGDVWVGRSSDGALHISPSGFVPALNYYALTPANGPLFWGWTDSNPGFDRITAPEPVNDILPLESGCDIWLELLAVDPAFVLIDGGWNYIDTPGEATRLGGSGLHVHNTWHINSNDGAYDPSQCVWRATFFLRDEGGTGYADSIPITFMFATVSWGPRENPPVYADGDFDQDNAVGPADLAALETCLSGPERFCEPDEPAITTCEVDCVNAFDFGDDIALVDLDVDMLDVAEFQVRYGAP